MDVAARAWLCALTVAVGAVWSASPAGAQSQLGGGSSAFGGSAPSAAAPDRPKSSQTQYPRAKGGYTQYPRYMDGGGKPDIAPEAPPVVYLDNAEQPGTIIIDTKGRQLYYVLPGKRAYAYPISVGRDGYTWTGTERISRIASWPSWTPPPEMHARQPGLPITVSGGVINPLGAKALYLGSSIYRIHGTNNARSIGRASSSGCFRMMNKHVNHLATLARVGTKVRVVSSYAGGVNESMPLSMLFSSWGGDEEEKPAPKKKRKTSRKN